MNDSINDLRQRLEAQIKDGDKKGAGKTFKTLWNHPDVREVPPEVAAGVIREAQERRNRRN